MPMLTLGQAAKLTGLGKTTITRAIKAGRLSATRREDGSYEIDPAELTRVYSVRPETPETIAQPGILVHRATPNETPRDHDVTVRLAALETQVQGLKDLLEEVRQSREEWKDQATRLVHALPPPQSHQRPAEGRSWWRRLVG
jgi:excisionase family DNA binding protein